MRRFIAMILALALAAGTVIAIPSHAHAADIAISGAFSGWLNGIMFNLFGISVGHEIYEMLTEGDLEQHIPAGTITATERAKLEQWGRETMQSGQIALDTETRRIWGKIAKSVAENGFVVGQPTAGVIGLADCKSWWMSNGYNMVDLDSLYSAFMNYGAQYTGNPTMFYYKTSAKSMLVGFYSDAVNPNAYWKDESNGLRRLWSDSGIITRASFATYDNTQNVWARNGNITMGTAALYVAAYDGFRGVLGSKAAAVDIPASDAGTIADADAGTMAIITPFTDATDFDNTKPVVIPIPQVLPVPAENVADIPGVIAQLPAVVTDTDDTTIPTIAADLAASYPAAGDYNLGLTNFFPFCIPFDLYDILTSFAADPVAPSITISMPVGYDPETGAILQEFEVDLSQFDSVAQVLRMLELVLFGVGLAVATRQIYLRG